MPIKANFERAPGKNFRVLNGHKLYEYICEHMKSADVNTDEDLEIAKYVGKMVWGIN